MHTYGFRPAGTAICDNTPGGKTSFVKAHVTPKHKFTVWGNVGH